MAPHSLPPAKKRKVTQKSTASQFKALENDISNALANNGSLNALADAICVMQDTADPRDVSKIVYALYRSFVLIISNGRLSLDKDEKSQAVKKWILEHLSTYVDYLGGLLQDEEKFLRISALQILFSLLKHLSTSYTNSAPDKQPQIHASHFRKLVSFLLLCPPSSRPTSSSRESTAGIIDPDVLDHFYETWLSVHDDIRWFFLRDSGSLLNARKGPRVAQNLLSILERLITFPTDPEELNEWWISEFSSKPTKGVASSTEGNEEDEGDDDWRKFFEDEEPVSKAKEPTSRLHRLTLHQCLHSLPSHRAVFTRTWLSLLPQISDIESIEARKAAVKKILNILHRGVLPHITRAILVMDWVAGCVDLGGSVGLLALNALFILMKEHNLDYPSFYTRLYAFLDRDLLHLRHRARFFRLTDLFLSSTHIPAALLAAFIKRLSRLSLTAPPAAIVTIIPFTYNILKRHPALMVMISRDHIDGLPNDPFLSSEPDPIQSHAIESSLWELLTHSNHYHPPIATLCKVFSEAFTKPNYSMEDFLDHTYATLFSAEADRKIKKEPSLADELKRPPFSQSVDPSHESTEIVSSLWNF